MNPCCDLAPKNSKPTCLHDTLAHDDASQYQVWQLFVGLEDIIWTNIDILTCAVTLTLIAVIQFFSQNTLA